jgi:YihY family inner membrane protein
MVASMTSESEKEIALAKVSPALPAAGPGAQLVALAKYMARTEVHTYAFSVAANVILSLFPFIVMMLTISRHVFHSQAMVDVVGQMMSVFLPSNQDFIIARMKMLVHPHASTQLYSIAMLLISSTGIFLPLEVALNSVWGVRENRSYLHNQLVSLGLAIAIGLLAMASVALTAWQRSALTWIFFNHTGNAVFRFFDAVLDGGLIRILALVASILIFFLIYWVLPNRKVPARAVLPTAIVIGLLWEAAKLLYIFLLPRLDFYAVYGPFYVSVTLMIWAFLSGLLLLAGAHFSATRHALSIASRQELKDVNDPETQREQNAPAATGEGETHAARV